MFMEYAICDLTVFTKVKLIGKVSKMKTLVIGITIFLL